MISSSNIVIHDSESFSHAVNAIASHSRLSLQIYSLSLMEPVFVSEFFYQQVKRIALAHSTAKVHLLVKETRLMIQNAHPLIRLLQRLPSFIQLKKLPDEEEIPERILILGDTRHFADIKTASGFSGTAWFDNPVGFREIQTEFERWWQLAEIPMDGRRLSL